MATRWTAVLSMILGGVASLFASFALATPAGAVIEDPDVDTFAIYQYRVLPDSGAVDVTITLEVTADKPNQSIGDGGYYEYYFQGYFLAIPREAEEIEVLDSSGTELRYVIDESIEDIQVLEIDFRRNIFYRQTANVVVSYRLPAGEARSSALTRVNEAYAGFEIWLTPQLESASVRVIAPNGFDDLSTGSQPFLQAIVDGERHFTAEDVDPETYWALASLSRDDALTTTEIEVDGHHVQVSAWPGDAAWTQHVTSNLEQGLPALIEHVGLPWPIEGDLSIVESYSPYLSGYAGWYDPNTDEIEIGDKFDNHLVFHELSHVWFNEELFRQRWITEGLADVFGAAVVESLGGTTESPQPTSPTDSDTLPLNIWRTYGTDAGTESWSYGASWTVTDAIVDVVGLETLAAAVQAASNDQISYLGDADPEAGPTTKDWRLYLDLIENRGAVTSDEITELFTTWVLLKSQEQGLQARATSRTTYADLVESGEKWAAPLGVRIAMSDWRFDAADELMVTAGSLLDERDKIHKTLEPLRATLPAALEVGYESADEDFTEVAELMASTADAADQLGGTYERVNAVSGPLQWAGAIGTDYSTDLDAAISAFEAGRIGQATEQSLVIDDGVAGLRQRGIIRIAVAVALLLTLLVLMVWLIRRRRHPQEPSVDDSHSRICPAGSGRLAK